MTKLVNRHSVLFCLFLFDSFGAFLASRGSNFSELILNSFSVFALLFDVILSEIFETVIFIAKYKFIEVGIY